MSEIKFEYVDHMGEDLMVANVARVSFDKWHDEFDDDKDARLIRYLAKHNHQTPFFHPQIQIRITAPIFIARQLFRSVIGVARNEKSRRYVSDTPEFYVPTEWRKKPDGNIKQGSGEVAERVTQYKAELAYQRVIEETTRAYESLLEWGIAPEMARMVLPQSMMTTWIETGSLAYWARVYRLRSDSHAQLEAQICAEQIAKIVQPLFPVAWEALTNQEAS